MAAVGRTGPRGRNGTLRPITARKRSGRSSAACVVDRRGPQPLCVLHETGLVAGRNIAVASSYCDDPAVPLERQHERSTAGPPRAREAEHALPVDGRIVGNREHGGRIEARSTPIVVSSGGTRPRPPGRSSVGIPRPEASITNSEPTVSVLPAGSVYRTPVTAAPSGRCTSS